MKITKKMKIAFESTRDCWKWLSETGRLAKNMWPEYERVVAESGDCAFCIYFKKTVGSDEQQNCRDCPLCRETKIDSSPCMGDTWYKWYFAETIRTRKKYAKIMFKAIKKWCKENL